MPSTLVTLGFILLWAGLGAVVVTVLPTLWSIQRYLVAAAQALVVQRDVIARGEQAIGSVELLASRVAVLEKCLDEQYAQALKEAAA